MQIFDMSKISSENIDFISKVCNVEIKNLNIQNTVVVNID